MDMLVVLLGMCSGDVWVVGSYEGVVVMVWFDGEMWIWYFYDDFFFVVDWWVMFELFDGLVWFGVFVDIDGLVKY